MLGVGVFGSSTAESLQFDSLLFQTTPALTMEKVGNNVVLSWLGGFAGYSLQSKPDLSQREVGRRLTEPRYRGTA